MKTHYNTLGVPKNASKKEIKAAFCKLSLETHPDVTAGAANVEHFKQISEAHWILSNETKQ
jgi:curved DNA-binding protein CbpA